VRVWDIHPGYLSRPNLLGQHAEIHALYSIITGGKKGYAKHPETRRWQGRPNGLKRVHDLTVLEMALRGFNHSSPCGGEPSSKWDPEALRAEENGPEYVDEPLRQFAILEQKNREKERAGRIPLPKDGFTYWAHHKYSVMARGYNHYKDIQAYLRPLDSCPLQDAGELIEIIANVMARPVDTAALANVVDHIWGYFKREAQWPEKEIYLNRQPEDLPSLIRYFYNLAVKYKRDYLLHSTIFADFIEPV